MIRKKRIKRFLTLLASFILVVHVNAQYVYQPFVKEGKIWILKDFDYNDYQYQMEGDTVIAGEVMKKVYLIDHAFYHDNDLHYLGAVKEVDRKVYITYADEDTSMLLYDFSIEPSSLTHSPSVITYDKWY